MRRKKISSDPPGPRALMAYKRRWGSAYSEDFDDSQWWKWFDGYEFGRRQALRESRKRAEGKNGDGA